MFKLIFGLLLFTAAMASHAETPSQPSEISEPAPTWNPPEGLMQVPIWPDAAPDMAGVPHADETVFDVKKSPNKNYVVIANVTSPTMTIFPPKGNNTGAAIVVFPGGGYQILAMDVEGTEICDWITANGITCVLPK